MNFFINLFCFPEKYIDICTALDKKSRIEKVIFTILHTNLL
jgi:hypothetical protein